MQNMLTKLVLIISILALCAWSIFPVRLGRDLRGGVSLIYKVEIEDGARASEVLQQTIDVLKERVNPRGVLDISMQPLGLDRIEIVMPLPSEEVKALRAEYEAALELLLDQAEIRPGDLDVALRDESAPDRFGSQGDRGQRIQDLQEAFIEWQVAVESFDDARAAGMEGAELNQLARSAAEIEVQYDDLRAEVLRMSLDRRRIVRALNLPTVRRVVEDETGEVVLDEAGEPVMSESQRDKALAGLKVEFPGLADGVDDLVRRFDEYQANRKGFDDPQDLIRLLQGAGELEFRIAVSTTDTDAPNAADMRQQLIEVGPENTDSPIARWLPINDTKQWYNDPPQRAQLLADPVTYFASTYQLVAAEHDEIIYLMVYSTPQKILVHDKDDTPWTLTSTFPTVDQLGRPAVGFRLDPQGGAKMARLTGAHVNKPMAIVLDDEVYSAPNLNSQISNSGIIMGNFSQSELNYLTRVLAAGALEAKLSKEPIATSVLGPTIGADNLKRGLEAFVISIIVVCIFMLIYYFFAGLVADLALLANGVIIFGFMGLIDGTFTLPGLAGIVLTVGMAVDANVLIYERIREELFAEEDVDIKTAIREGYAKALSTIIDANVTNLIVCFVLLKTATTEVKGFATTLAIGICATLFTALFVTRQIYYLYTEFFGAKKLAMLPTAVPAVHRALEPNIRWTSLRRIFWPVSLVAVTLSIVLVAGRGVDMFDTELRGGVAATMQTAPLDASGDDNAPRIQLAQTEVESRVHAIAEQASADATDVMNLVMREFANATILTEGETQNDDQGRITADRFQIKVANPKDLDANVSITDTVVELLTKEFGDQLEVRPPLTFSGTAADSTFAIESPDLGEVVSGARGIRVPDFIGGVAVYIDDISPPAEIEDVRGRIEQMRNQPDFADYVGRDVEVWGIEAADANDASKGYRSIVVVVGDPNFSVLRVDRDVWEERLADPEWELVSTALAEPPSLKQVNSYSAAVANTLAANAVVAVILTLLGILVYIWVRFGSLRYSLAAIVALVHDVSIALGVLALTGIVAGGFFTDVLLIEEFRIDLGVVAALLTIIGYSLNDTIVILDRIRENRGKLPLASEAVVNRSINQTVSRTLLTSVTTLLAVGIMYVDGGTGIRPFTFCLLIGLCVGTYSSVAIAAPLVFRTRDDSQPTETTTTTVAEENSTPEPAGV